MPFNKQVWIRVWKTAACSPPEFDPRKVQLRRPSVWGRIARSTALLVISRRPVFGEAAERLRAIEAVADGLGEVPLAAYPAQAGPQSRHTPHSPREARCSCPHRARAKDSHTAWRAHGPKPQRQSHPIARCYRAAAANSSMPLLRKPGSYAVVSLEIDLELGLKDVDTDGSAFENAPASAQILTRSALGSYIGFSDASAAKRSPAISTS